MAKRVIVNYNQMKIVIKRSKDGHKKSYIKAKAVYVVFYSVIFPSFHAFSLFNINSGNGNYCHGLTTAYKRKCYSSFIVRKNYNALLTKKQ